LINHWIEVIIKFNQSIIEEVKLMGFFNGKHFLAMLTGEYPCPECGTNMFWEDDSEEVLICPSCGHEETSDHYGFTDEEYDNLYPTKEEVCGDDGAGYDEEDDWH
jgi:Zn ribbon nucleic-acid-binding protein